MLSLQSDALPVIWGAVISFYIQFTNGCQTFMDNCDPDHYPLTVTLLDATVVYVWMSPATVVAEGKSCRELDEVEMTVSEVLMMVGLG